MFIMSKVHSSEKLLYIQKDDFLCLSIVGSVSIHTYSGVSLEKLSRAVIL